MSTLIFKKYHLFINAPGCSLLLWLLCIKTCKFASFLYIHFPFKSLFLTSVLKIAIFSIIIYKNKRF